MVFSEIRAQAWKYGCIAFATLAVVAVLTVLWFRADAIRASGERAAAEQERDSARAEVDALKQSRARDDRSAALTVEARSTVADATAISDARATQVEVRYRDRIVEVPANCPVPDAGLMQELAEQAARLSAAEDRLRRTGRSTKEAP